MKKENNIIAFLYIKKKKSYKYIKLKTKLIEKKKFFKKSKN